MTAVVLLVSSHFGVQAQVIHRCRSGSGAVSYQGHPCPAGTHASTRTYAPVRDDPAAGVRLQQVEEQAQAHRANKTGTPGKHGPATRTPPGMQAPTRQRPRQDARDRQRARCQAAKSRRDATLERVGLRRTFDLLRRLDDRVHAACKGL